MRTSRRGSIWGLRVPPEFAAGGVSRRAPWPLQAENHMADRYFVDTPISDDRVLLAGPEAHHLIHVMRARRGTRVVLFDGSGTEFSARVERFGRTGVE
jgi:hypothetical protein